MNNKAEFAEKYWHVAIRMDGKKGKPFIANDLTFQELKRSVIDPWNAERPFSVSGVIVRSPDSVSEIRIVQTQQPMQRYADEHDARARARNIVDMATNRRELVFSKGVEHTFELLFSGDDKAAPEPDAAMVERICARLPQTARVLANRSRKGRAPFDINDEYDVQDLLHSILRAYLKYSVQEDPLPKIAGAKSSRADISIEELGVLIEIKYARGPEDQKRIFEEYSQDLVLYAGWPSLRTLIYLIYNSADLKDPEAFDKLSGDQSVNGKDFRVRVILA